MRIVDEEPIKLSKMASATQRCTEARCVPTKQSQRLFSSDKHCHAVTSLGRDYSNQVRSEFLEFRHQTKRKDLGRRGKRAPMTGLAALTQIQAAGRGVDNRRCFVFILGATWE